MSKIVLTGGSSPSGGFLVKSLRDAGHTVVTLGKGDNISLDFRYLTPAHIHKAADAVVRGLKGRPDVLIHNARISEPSNLNHVLYANINARIFLDRIFLALHQGADTPFRSVHILGWGPEWADPREEIVVSNAAQQAIPAALCARVKPLEQAAKEADHQRELALKKHEKDQDRQERLHEEAEDRNERWHAEREKEYERKPFPRAEFRDTIGPVWVPNVDAVLLVPHPDRLANGHITREGLSEQLGEALELPHKTGELKTIIVE